MEHEQQIVKRKLSDEVLDRLMALIKSGEFAPGDTFPSERELMKQFGVGRPAVREAMQSLQNAGLISVNQGHRPKVTEPTAHGMISQLDIAARHLLDSSPGSLDHLKEARLLLEVGIVRRAAETANGNDIKVLRAALDRQKETYLSEPDKFVKADMEFHIAIAESTKNPIFVATSRAMLGWLENYHTSIVRLDGKEPITLGEHQKIFEMIEAGDPDGAAYAMTDHLNRSREIFRKES
jgi:DNA-binding FadR family transcriptional regulator